MPPEKEASHEEMLRLLRDNNELLKKDHELLRKIYRNDMIGFGFRVVWFAIIIGLPFAVYFYFLEPYLEVFGVNSESFRQSMELFLPAL